MPLSQSLALSSSFADMGVATPSSSPTSVRDRMEPGRTPITWRVPIGERQDANTAKETGRDGDLEILKRGLYFAMEATDAWVEGNKGGHLKF